MCTACVRTKTWYQTKRGLVPSELMTPNKLMTSTNEGVGMEVMVDLEDLQEEGVMVDMLALEACV